MVAGTSSAGASTVQQQPWHIATFLLICRRMIKVLETARVTWVLGVRVQLCVHMPCLAHASGWAAWGAKLDRPRHAALARIMQAR